MTADRLNGSVKKVRKLIPFGNRILVRRRPVGKTLGNGIILAAETTADTLTEIADVVALPDLTFADKALIENAESIINALTAKANEGDASAVDSLIEYNRYLQIKTLQVGDVVMVGKYTGIDFTVGETGELLSITDPEGIRGLMVNK